jgi:hypothetical protein
MCIAVAGRKDLDGSKNPPPGYDLYSLAVMLFAAGDEFHQSFISSRTPSVVDAGIDALGGFLATCTIILWKTFSAGLIRSRVGPGERIGSNASRMDSRRDE